MLNWMLNDSQVAFGSSGIIALCRSHTRRCPLSALICLPSGKGVRSRESLSPMVTQWSQLGRLRGMNSVMWLRGRRMVGLLRGILMR